jgi:hypothetical protein
MLFKHPIAEVMQWFTCVLLFSTVLHMFLVLVNCIKLSKCSLRIFFISITFWDKLFLSKIQLRRSFSIMWGICENMILLCELYKTLGCDTSVTVRLLSLATMLVPPRGDGVGS